LTTTIGQPTKVRTPLRFKTLRG